MDRNGRNKENKQCDYCKSILGTVCHKKKKQLNIEGSQNICIMGYKEKDFQSLFTKWMRENRKNLKLEKSMGIELKISKDNSIPFSRVEEHQVVKLYETKHSCVYQKHSDQSMGFKPYDVVQICFSPAFIVILFYKPRKEKVMYWIDIDVFIKETQISKRKSLTEQRAKEISDYIFNL